MRARVARHGAGPSASIPALGRVWLSVVPHPRPGAADRFVRRRWRASSCAKPPPCAHRRASSRVPSRATHLGIAVWDAEQRLVASNIAMRALYPAHRGPLRDGRPLRRLVARVLRRGACGCGRRPFARPVRARLDGALESARSQRSGTPARQPLAADDRRAYARGRHGELPPAVHGAADPRCAPRQAPRRARRTRRHDLRLVLAPGRATAASSSSPTACSSCCSSAPSNCSA